MVFDSQGTMISDGDLCAVTLAYISSRTALAACGLNTSMLFTIVDVDDKFCQLKACCQPASTFMVSAGVNTLFVPPEDIERRPAYAFAKGGFIPSAQTPPAAISYDARGDVVVDGDHVVLTAMALMQWGLNLGISSGDTFTLTINNPIHRSADYTLTAQDHNLQTRLHALLGCSLQANTNEVTKVAQRRYPSSMPAQASGSTPDNEAAVAALLRLGDYFMAEEVVGSGVWVLTQADQVLGLTVRSEIYMGSGLVPFDAERIWLARTAMHDTVTGSEVRHFDVGDYLAFVDEPHADVTNCGCVKAIHPMSRRVECTRADGSVFMDSYVNNPLLSVWVIEPILPRVQDLAAKMGATSWANSSVTWKLPSLGSQGSGQRPFTSKPAPVPRPYAPVISPPVDAIESKPVDLGTDLSGEDLMKSIRDMCSR